MSNGTVIVGGFIGILPAGGVTWDYIQYVLGFKKLGFDVIYLEDTRLYPIYQQETDSWDDTRPIIKNLMRIMESFGLGNDWIYRDEVSGSSFGMDLKLFLARCKSADYFINVSCSTVMRDEYAQIPNRIIIDSDPMFTQIQLVTQQSFTDNESKTGLLDLMRAHNYHFTFGENIKHEKCLIPKTEFDFTPTRQPIVLDYWKYSQPNHNKAFTTLMNWSAGKTLAFEGLKWGQKDLEFPIIENVPLQLQNLSFEIAVSKTGGQLNPSEKEAFRKKKWKLIESSEASGNEQDYQKFIKNSIGELSVAKQTYVKSKSGWFSCRSACYLAAGRPVITQDTGWSKYYTTGIGLFSFSNQQEAIEAIELVRGDLVNQSQAARNIAEAYFDSDKVLLKLLERVEIISSP